MIDGKVVPWRCIVDPKRKLCHYTVMDEYSRNFTLGAHEKQSVSSSTDFLCQVVAHFVRKGFTAACILAYNDFEIISRFFNSKGDLEICFETWAKHVRPYTPWCNWEGKEQQFSFHESTSLGGVQGGILFFLCSICLTSLLRSIENFHSH